MKISIRMQCVPAFDLLRRIESVHLIPLPLCDMDEKTAGGILKKLESVVASPFFAGLPEEKIIKSGSVEDCRWVKQEELKAAREILDYRAV